MRLSGLGASIDTVAQTIQTVEGYYPGSLAYRNNNPGNLRPAGQPGCTPVNGFCKFQSYDDGYQALLNQINLDASRGLTVEQFTKKYAPADDGNDPESYAALIARAAGVSVNDSLASVISGYGGYDYGDYNEVPADFADTTDWGTLALVGGAAALLYAII